MHQPAIFHTRIRERDSNIELLRIVCMLFILIHHFIIHALYPDLLVRDGVINGYRVACILINGFVYVGVNCFILISGYYGIKFRIRSLFNLYCICVFYALLTAILFFFLADKQFDKGVFYTILLPFSHSEWWFIKCYVGLFLISPLLNKAAQYLNKNEFVTSIVLLTVLNVYLGYYWHQHNIDGYNLLQFIYVYFIGAFLKKFPLRRFDRKYSLLLYLICALSWCLLSILSIRWRVPHWISFYYNNPLVLLAATGLFLYMTQVEIQRNNVINTVASTVLAAYLIQDVPGGFVYTLGVLFNKSFISPLANGFFKIMTMAGFVTVGSLIILSLAFCLERFRSLLMKPIWKMYDFSVSR